MVPERHRHRPEPQRHAARAHATIGHASHMAALRYQHAAMERSKAIATISAT